MNHQQAQRGPTAPSGPRKRSMRRRLAAVGVAGLAAIAVAAFALTQSSSAQSPPTKASLAVTSGGTSHSKSQPTVTVTAMSRGSFGKILVTGSGATLYRYTPDKPNMPTCRGGCATAWPPLVLPAGAGPVRAGGGLTGLSSVVLPNGDRQVTYDRMPLYRFADDSGTSVNGQGIGGVWYVVHPASSAPASHAGATSTSSGAVTGGGYGY